MRFLKTSIIILITMMLAIVLASCSGSSKNQSPLEPTNQVSDLPLSFGTEDSGGRSVLAVYDAVIDPVAKTFTVTPSERTGTYHFPLTQLYPNVLKIVGYGWTPSFWADIKLTHPLPGSGIDGFDPRVIAILPANPGVSFNYPIFNCVGNNKVLYEPDGYTKLFDNLGGSISGNTNPFKAYFQDQPNRVWSSTGVTQETQRWQMDIGGFGGPLQFKLVVDVSTNYPNPPQPIIDNAPEPAQIKSFIERNLTTDGGNSLIEVTLLDWQGASDIKCKIEAPDLFASTVQLFYSRPGPNPDEHIFSGTISNSLLAPVGEYGVLIAAWDIPMNVHLFSETTATVSDSIPADGNLIWAKRAGGSGGDVGYGITTLSDNSTVVTGYFGYLYGGSATFGPGETNETVLTSSGRYDIFIARYNPDGTLAWAKRAGGTGFEESEGITVLSDNSIVVTGEFNVSATYGPGEINETILYSAGDWDIFIARYNPDGTLAWAKRAGGVGGEGGYGITRLSDNSTVVTGEFNGLATFGKDEANQTDLAPAGSYDIFIARYNPDGTLAWAKRAGGSDWDAAFGITTLLDNSIAVTGHFEGSCTFGPGDPAPTVLTSAGGADIFIANYNPNGTSVWAKRAGGSDLDWGNDLTTLSDNSTVVTGWFYDSATFGPGEPNEIVLWSAGYVDIFIARYNPDGILAWAKSAGGSSDWDRGYGITALMDNSTVVTGYFYGSATFGQGEVNQTILNSAGNSDIFTARYNPDGTLAWTKRAGGVSDDIGYGITILSDNSTVVTGYYGYYDGGPATFGPGEPNEIVLTSAGNADIFIARFEP